MSTLSVPTRFRGPGIRLLAGVVALFAALALATPLAAVASPASYSADAAQHVGAIATAAADQHSNAPRVDLPLVLESAPLGTDTPYVGAPTADSSPPCVSATVSRVHTRGPPPDGRTTRPSVHL